MDYTAYALMREKNKERFGKLDGPEEPFAFDGYRIWETDENGRKMKEPTFTKGVSELEKYAVKFIRERCKELRFDRSKMEMNDLDGTSLKKGQIPYNFQMDIDRRCLEVAVHRFMESGMAKDAFDVYFCYLEMFIGSYGKTKKMIEMLSEFESNASSLLMKHRDHYSHSVYVFIIGMAYYESSKSFREAYEDRYGKFVKIEDGNKETALAAHFLKYWGLTSLFHDIGYPFELSFEQVKSYFGDTINYVPFVTYNMNEFQHCNMKRLLEDAQKLLEDCKKCDIDESKAKKDIRFWISSVYDDAEVLKKLKEKTDSIFGCEKLSGIKELVGNIVTKAKQKLADTMEKLNAMAPENMVKDDIEDMNRFFANALCSELCSSNDAEAEEFRNYLYTKVLEQKPEHPEYFGGYIDHAYFSTMMLFSTLLKVLKKEDLNEMYTHSLTAILLHNSLFKFSIMKNEKSPKDIKDKPFSMNKHPLAYLLMLCDELQCWDRMAYGRTSRGEVHPFSCKFNFDGDKITAVYQFDSRIYSDKANGELKKEYKEANGSYRKLSDESSGADCDFLKEIRKIIDIGNDNLKTYRKLSPNKRYRKSYLSTTNFIHLYKFAVLVHYMNHLDGNPLNDDDKRKMEESFEEMSLEYKINHISRVKKFAKVLKEIDCFYSDKVMDCEIVTEFSEDDELEKIMAPIEHERWCWEHWIMGWKYVDKALLAECASEYASGERLIVRECTKLHPMMPYFEPGERYDQQKAEEHYWSITDNEEKEKDKRAWRNLLKVLSFEDGIRIYRLE